MKPIKIAFLGNSDISIDALKSLLVPQIKIEVVITGCDQKVGRNHSNLQPNPLAKFATEKQLNVFKTDSINNDFAKIANLEVDYIITCSFGQFLSPKVLSWPKILPINIHTSILPKGRGGAPIHWAIIKGELETGYSVMEMVDKMDAGDIYFLQTLPITTTETYDSLYAKLSTLIKETFLETFLNHVVKTPLPKPQDETKVELWLNIKKEDRKINWGASALAITNHVNGLNSKPMAFTIYNDFEIKISQVKVNDRMFPMARKMFRPGEIVTILDDVIIVETGSGLIQICELTIPGKKQILFKEFKKGNPDFFSPFTRFS